MKRLIGLALVVLFAVILGACAKASSQTATAAPQMAEGMINPGDKIGDFLITTGSSDGISYLWEFDWEKQSSDTELYSGTINTDIKLNVSWGVYDDSNSGKLDEFWSGHTYRMFINDRPVNLDAFGSIDVVHPIVGKMRHWNVVIIATKSGEITVRSEGIVDGEPFGDTKIFTFKAP